MAKKWSDPKRTLRARQRTLQASSVILLLQSQYDYETSLEGPKPLSQKETQMP